MGAALANEFGPCPAGSRLLLSSCALTSGLTSLAATGRGGPTLERLALLTQFHFLCNLANVEGKKRYWTLLTSLLYRPIQDIIDIAMSIVELQLAGENLREKEAQLGTTRFLCWSALATACTNLLFLGMAKSMDQRGSGLRYLCNQGLWPIASVCMTLRALDIPASRNTRVRVLGMLEVPSRWYPLSFALAVSALRGIVQWDMFAAIGCGHAFRLLPIEDLVPSRRLVARLERLKFFRSLVWLLSSATGGQWVWAEDHRREPDRWVGPLPEAQARPFQLFGGQGRRLVD